MYIMTDGLLQYAILLFASVLVADELLYLYIVIGSLGWPGGLLLVNFRRLLRGSEDFGCGRNVVCHYQPELALHSRNGDQMGALLPVSKIEF